jgi:hypothetical protein
MSTVQSSHKTYYFIPTNEKINEENKLVLGVVFWEKAKSENWVYHSLVRELGYVCADCFLRRSCNFPHSHIPSKPEGYMHTKISLRHSAQKKMYVFNKDLSKISFSSFSGVTIATRKLLYFVADLQLQNSWLSRITTMSAIYIYRYVSHTDAYMKSLLVVQLVLYDDLFIDVLPGAEISPRSLQSLSWS